MPSLFKGFVSPINNAVKYFYAPNFKEVEEVYWLMGLPSVCVHPWVTRCIRSRTVRDRILKFEMWNKCEK